MNWQRFSLPIRIAIALSVGYAMVRFLFAGAHGEHDPGTKIIGLLVAAVYGLILFLLFGFDILRQVGERFARIYEPHDKHFRIRPEYSVAEARVKQGKYAQAIEEYRKVIAQYPEDVYSHLRIAELAVEHLNDVKLAELELLSAFGKATSDDPIVLTAGRLADFYQDRLQQPQRALEVMEQLRDKLPGTKHAAMAEERIRVLRALIAGGAPPPQPTKIACRPADEERRKRWLHGP